MAVRIVQIKLVRLRQEKQHIQVIAAAVTAAAVTAGNAATADSSRFSIGEFDEE